MAGSSDFPPDTSQPPSRPALATRKLVPTLALFVFVGIPLAALVWDALNRLTAGIIDAPLLLGGLIALGLLVMLFRILARVVTGWEAERFD